MELGIITGREIAKNRDGDADRLLLQVKTVDLDPDNADIKTVELISEAGLDVNPADGCRVVILEIVPGYKVSSGITDDLLPEVDPGEKEIYSTDNPATAKQARTKWDAAGNVVHNQGTNSAVSYAALNTALQLLVTAINAALATKLDGGGSVGVLTLDISSSESATVKLP